MCPYEYAAAFCVICFVLISPSFSCVWSCSLTPRMQTVVSNIRIVSFCDLSPACNALSTVTVLSVYGKAKKESEIK